MLHYPHRYRPFILYKDQIAQTILEAIETARHGLFVREYNVVDVVPIKQDKCQVMTEYVGVRRIAPLYGSHRALLKPRWPETC